MVCLCGINDTYGYAAWYSEIRHRGGHSEYTEGQTLNVQTVVHIFQVYVIPVLLYGLEVAVPSRANLDTLERFLRTSLKQILSLPINTASTAVHILTCILPYEAMIHKRVLALFGSICRLSDDSVEK